MPHGGRFLRSSASEPLACLACGEFAYAPKWVRQSISTVGQALFWFSPLVALLWGSWVPILVAVPLYCLWWWAAYSIAKPVAYDNDRSRMNFRRPVSFGQSNAKESRGGDAV